MNGGANVADQQEDEDLQFHTADAGVAFRTEMAATNFLIGYWKHVLAVMILGLISLVIFDQIRTASTNAQRETSAQIAKVERDLPVPIYMVPVAKLQGSEGLDDDALRAAAVALATIGQDSSGVGAAEAHLKAAELYRVVGDNAERRTQLEAAQGSAKGVLSFSVESALATLDIEDGDVDAGIQRYRGLMADSDAYLAQQAALELGTALEALGRQGEAGEVYANFLTRWPDAATADEVRIRQSRAGDNG